MLYCHESDCLLFLASPLVDGLEAEREQLLLKVAALEEEVSALSGITEDVEERLDGAIGEIRAALARS